MATLIPPALLLLAMLVVRRRSTLAPLPLAIDDRSKVQEAHNSRTNGISNDSTSLRASQLQTETTVHHAEHDGDATNANVSVRHGRATAVLLERTVVKPASERLCKEGDEQHDADDRVCASEVLLVHGDPDADAEGDDVDEEAEDLQSGVDPDEAGEARNADEDAADREEGDESERSHDTVCEDHGIARAAEGAATAILRELIA